MQFLHKEHVPRLNIDQDRVISKFRGKSEVIKMILQLILKQMSHNLK